MGKYIRKGKGVGKVGVMEISQASLGLRTRARALALEKEQKPSVGKRGSSKPQQSAFNERRQTAYLELRSRRLEKVIFHISTDISSQTKDLRKVVSECRRSRVSSSEMFDDSSSGFILSEEARDNPQRRSTQVSEADCQQFECGKSPFRSCEAPMRSSLNGSNISLHHNNSGLQTDTVMATVSISTSNSAPITQDRPPGILTRNQRRQEKRIMMGTNHNAGDKGVVTARGMEAKLFGNDGRIMEVQAFFGETPMDHDRLSVKDSQMSYGTCSRERESTPSSYTRDIDAPGSATRSSRRKHVFASATLQGRLPDSELEDFFRSAEQQEQRRFTERYNFDPVNGRPLTGRYEWVRM